MLYRKHKAYILAIHGCKYWAATGFGLGEVDLYIEDHFNTYHYADGGTALDCLVASPTFSHVIDVTGGFGRVSDASFEIIDTHNDYFAKFFAASKVSNAYTSTTATFDRTDSSISVGSTSGMTAGEDWVLQQETIRISSVTTDYVAAVARSKYSAFIEGRWNSHAQVSPALDAGSDVVKGGHWNHRGRWVCVYEAETDYTGQFGTPKRIYAGTINDTSFDGRKITISTKSITSMLSSPLVLAAEYKLDENVVNVLTEELYTVNRGGGDMSVMDPAVITTPFLNINEFIINDLNYRALNVYFSGFSYTGVGGLLTVNYLTTSLTEVKAPSNVYSHPAITEFYNLTDTVRLNSATTYMTSSGSDSEHNYDSILLPGWKFKFSSDTAARPALRNQFFMFDDKIIVPCEYNVGTDTWNVVEDDPLDQMPWFDKDGNLIAPLDEFNRPAHWFCLNRANCVVKAVLCPATSITLDLLPMIYQLMTSTGEAVNPDETEDFDWYQSMCFPYYLVDYDSFVSIGYPVRPMITEKTTIIDTFEQCVKIGGWRIVWSFQTGQLTARQLQMPSSNNALLDYTLTTQDISKPPTQIGYQAPLSSCSLEFKRAMVGGERTSVKYVFNMDSSVNQSNDGQVLALVDEWATQEYANAYPNIYSNLYWLSTMVPSSVIRVNEVLGLVGDTVTVTNKYIADGAGYGVTQRAGIQTEIAYGASPSIRCLFAGNTITDEFCMLAPSALVDLSIGTYGVDGGELYLQPAIFENGKNWARFVYDNLGTTAVSICLMSYNGSVVIENTTLDIINNRVILPAGTAMPSFLYNTYRSYNVWVTLANYWQYGS